MLNRVFLTALLPLSLAGCDLDAFEREVRIAERNQRVLNHCIPLPNERVLVQWRDGYLICKRYTPSKQYKPTEVSEAAVATFDDFR